MNTTSYSTLAFQRCSPPPPCIVRPPGPLPRWSCHPRPRPQPRRPRSVRPRLYCAPLCRSQAVLSPCSCKDRQERERNIGREHRCHKRDSKYLYMPSTAVAALRLPPLLWLFVLRARAREREREKKRDYSERRCHRLAMKGHGAIIVGAGCACCDCGFIPVGCIVVGSIVCICYAYLLLNF